MIPTEFTLVNRRWQVKQLNSEDMQIDVDEHDVSRKRTKVKDVKGLTSMDAAIIWINTDRHRHPADFAHTYYHELVHAILFSTGDMDHDEVKVDLMGGLLQQYMQTSKYETPTTS